MIQKKADKNLILFLMLCFTFIYTLDEKHFKLKTGYSEWDIKDILSAGLNPEKTVIYDEDGTVITPH